MIELLTRLVVAIEKAVEAYRRDVAIKRETLSQEAKRRVDEFWLGD